MEPLDHDPLFVAATRPALFLGLPIGLVTLFMLAFGLIIVLIQNPFEELILLPAWLAARLLVRYDYNAVRVAGLWLQTKARSLDTAHWGGASPSPFPVRLRRDGGQGRGLTGGSGTTVGREAAHAR
jgi:type IV secretion system protein VirB3